MDTALTPPPAPASERPEPTAPNAAPPALPTAKTPSHPRRFLLRLLRGLKSWLFATFSCLSIPLSIVFSGWTYRLVQRRAHTLWSKRLGQDPPSDRILPRWIVSERFKEDLTGQNSKRFLNRIRGFFRAVFGSFGANLKMGFLVVFNSLVLTLPGGVIMLFSWQAGWDNSFNKGYEQAAFGPLWGIAGMILFMVAMTYVPIAQARQAASGSPKEFWDYRKVRDVINRRPMACLLMVAGYALLGAVFMISVSALMFIGNGDAFADMATAQVIAFLNSYYFWWAAFFIVPGFLVLKLIAGRIYAGVAFEAVRDGSWKKEELPADEARIFADAPVEINPPALPGIMNASLRAFSTVGRATMGIAAFLLLLTLSFQLYVAQFFNYEPAANWLRQPMVQLPWYHNIPGHLKE